MSFRMGLVLSTFAPLAAGLAFVACGGSSSSAVGDGGHHDSGKGSQDGGKTSHDGGTATATDADISACNASSAALCALQNKCDLPTQNTQYGDMGTCVRRENISCLAALLAPNTGATTGHTAACAAAETTESCTNDLDNTTLSACAQPTGPGAAGSACSHAGQCASGFCATPPQDKCGTCAPTPTVGQSCANLSTCGQGLVCVKNTCITYTTAIGGPCSASQTCAPGLECVIPKDAGAGNCAATQTTKGAACDPTDEPDGGCDILAGFYCVADKALANYKTCQPVATAAVGGPCGRVDGVENVCANESECLKQADDAGSKCIARASDNGNCNTVTGPSCIPPSRCIGTALDGGTSGTCILPGTYSCP